MQSVCEENYRLENLSGSETARRDGRVRLRNWRTKQHQTCSCKLRRNEGDTEASSRKSYLRVASSRKWKVMFEMESTNHHRTCSLFSNPASTDTATFRIASCGKFLAGAVEASISITRGAGGFSISPMLRGARVVPRDSPAFELVCPDDVLNIIKWTEATISKSEFDELLDANIHELELLFRAGKASPCDVNLEGNTLLHVRVTTFSTSGH